MKLSDKDLREIEELVRTHCEEKGLTPDGYHLIISATLESKFQVSAMSGVPLSILKENPLVLWKRDRGDVHYYGAKIGNMLNNGKFKSMYQLVTQQRSDMFKRRDFGQKCLQELEDWLKTFNLELGMIFPDQIAKEFPNVRTFRQEFVDHLPAGLADLIRENSED
jgi:hypothetical protein